MARTPSLSTLRQFRILAQTANFSRAAELAHVSQPALSRTIRLLEEDLGARLFDRNRRHVSLTQAGEDLLRLTQRLIADFDDAFDLLGQTLSGQRGRIALGVLPSYAVGDLPAVLSRFREAWPGVDVTVREGLAGTIYQQLRERLIDLAVMTPPDDAAEDFTFLPLFTDPCALVCRSGHAPADPGWHSFADAPFIAMAPTSSVRQITDAAFARAGLAPRPLYECTQPATLGAFIAAGLGISALPLSCRPMVGAHDLEWHLLDDSAADRVIGIAHLSARSPSPAAQNMLRVLSAKGAC
ncbi:DNA-binding transcriptional LysR family regulator [Novosphingobium capsulatum]|uniref:DNA-binding transcriptional LysR family regulator n=1 Tax=Novosphingobium capsulatum TaxID=13688 RepID=A0ABU1MNZ2_9SPHN|nr:LysR substrate-binding domain-containing protein [Novosphingobium capsulatum]MDR6512070.1 DNA-binding transcriptional LysR family regulator [Novosphingobium capsulatum]